MVITTFGKDAAKGLETDFTIMTLLAMSDQKRTVLFLLSLIHSNIHLLIGRTKSIKLDGKRWG